MRSNIPNRPSRAAGRISRPAVACSSRDSLKWRDQVGLLTRVVVDGTPLLGTRTGVGRYTGHLLAALAAGPPGLDLAATAFTWRGLDGLADAVPAGVRAVGRRAPARFLHEAWSRTEFPPVEALTGRCDLV